MQTNFDDVAAFHAKFMVPVSPKPAFLDSEALQFRVKFMKEELTEFEDTHFTRDIDGAADALADLVYVAMGTAHMMGIPWQRVWDSIQTANMAKRMAKPDGSDSKRGSPLDVVKPEGWKAPDHTFALADAGFNYSVSPLDPINLFNATEVNRQLGETRKQEALTQAVSNNSPLTTAEVLNWRDQKNHERAMHLQVDRQSQTKTVL